MRFNRNATVFPAVVSALGSLIILAGCAEVGGIGKGHENVEGRMLHAPETFSGESTAGVDGEGSITLISDRGAHCSGPYRQIPDGNAAEVGGEATNNGLATLTCTDGRTGSVMFTVGADQAVGTGMLGQDIVTLTIEE